MDEETPPLVLLPLEESAINGTAPGAAWTDETQLLLALSLIGCLLLLKGLIFIAARPKRTQPVLTASRSIGKNLSDAKEAQFSPIDEGLMDDSYSLGNLLWKTLRWRRTLPDDAPSVSLFNALRLSSEKRSRSNMRFVQV
eukprot:scaffold135047_cov35-Tisochrysis_lutea.AAC.1